MSVIWSKSWLRAICCLLVLCSAAVAAADDVLKLVPDNALGVVVVNRVGSTNEKLKSLALRLNVPPFDFLSTAKLTLGLREALDEKGSVALAAVPSTPNGVPVMVSFVPTGDYAALLKQLQAEAGADGIAKLSVGDKRFVAAQKGGYAVVAEEANQPTLQAVIAATKSIADASPALDAWREENDAYAVATPAGVKFAQQQIQFGLQAAKAQMANQGEQGKAALAGLGMYDGLVAAMDKEISHSAIGLRMADDGAIHVVSRTLPVEGGALAKIASQAKPAKASPLAGLPQTPYFVAGGGVFTAGSMKSWMEISFRMMRSYPGGDKLTDEQIKKLSEISLKSMRGMRSMALLMGVGEGDEPLYSRMLLVMKTKDAKAYLDNYEAAMAEMMKIFKDAGFPAVLVRVGADGNRWPAGAEADHEHGAFLMGQGQGPEAKKMMELMFGSGGKMDVYMAVGRPADGGRRVRLPETTHPGGEGDSGRQAAADRRGGRRQDGGDAAARRPVGGTLEPARRGRICSADDESRCSAGRKVCPRFRSSPKRRPSALACSCRRPAWTPTWRFPPPCWRPFPRRSAKRWPNGASPRRRIGEETGVAAY